MSRRLASVVGLSIVLAILTMPVSAWEIQVIQLGFDLDSRRGELKTIKGAFTTVDPWFLQLVRFVRPPWPVSVGNQASGPAGSRPLNREYPVRWSPTSTWAYFAFTFPVLGTDLEEWTGTWTARVIVDGKEAGSSIFTLAKGDLVEGVSRYEKDVVANRNSFWAHYYLGAVLAQAGQGDAAIQHLQEASKISKTSFWPWYTLGRLYQRTGKKEEARNAYSMVKGLLMGYDDPSLSRIFGEWAELHLRELE